MVESPVLTLDSKGVWFRNVEQRWFICRSKIHDLFRLPMKVRKIQFYAYDKPRPETIPIAVARNVLWRYPQDLYLLEDDEFCNVPSMTMFDMSPLIGDKEHFHVACYYWSNPC